jgi:hypothetical protein
VLILPVRAAEGDGALRSTLPIAPENFATATLHSVSKISLPGNPGRRSGKPDSASTFPCTVAIPAAPAFSGPAVGSYGRQGKVGKLHEDRPTDFAGQIT